MSGNSERPILINDDFYFHFENGIINPTFLEFIYETTSEVYNSMDERAFRRFIVEENNDLILSRHAEAWYRRYALGCTAAQIAHDLNYLFPNRTLTDVTIMNNYSHGGWIKIYEEEMLPFAAIYAIRNMFFPRGIISYERGAPDIINDNSFIYVKIRRGRRGNNINNMITEEMKQLMKNGKSVKMVYIYYSIGWCRVDFFDLKIGMKSFKFDWSLRPKEHSL